MRGRLIVLEGTDGSGKATQAGLLLKSLAAGGLPCREIDFPRLFLIHVRKEKRRR